MKNQRISSLFLLFSGFLFFFSGCTGSRPSIETDDQVISELNTFISQWHESAAVSDHAAYIGAMDIDGIYIGTDATEYWTTNAFSTWSKPYFEKKKGWNLKKVNRHIYLSETGEFAWFDELLETGMGLCRGSGVLQKKDGQWLIFQYVLSPTVPNDLTNQVKTLKSGADSLLIRDLRSESDQ
ncbi:MAG: nuclear transport factor 2 family protein [Bacteroidales bacterium]|nr:nuclear transport factor 2 family protein [Bacteroidales bacterium]